MIDGGRGREVIAALSAPIRLKANSPALAADS